jgi:hypothetical protein
MQAVVTQVIKPRVSCSSETWQARVIYLRERYKRNDDGSIEKIQWKESKWVFINRIPKIGEKIPVEFI